VYIVSIFHPICDVSVNKGMCPLCVDLNDMVINKHKFLTKLSTDFSSQPTAFATWTLIGEKAVWHCAIKQSFYDYYSLSSKSLLK